MSLFDVKGYSFGFMGKCGDYLKPQSEQSLDELCKLGVNYIALCVVERVPSHKSTEIRYRYGLSLTDYEVEQMIAKIHARGVKVCLKPMINCADEWRARIAFDDKASWKLWFDDYMRFLCHYAQIAERTGCEMFCLGCEMLGTERQELHWRATVKAVREIYHGMVTYNTNHGKEHVAKWYDLLDCIGTSAYFPVTKHGNATLEEMQEGWERAAQELESVYDKWKKPILFMEIGCRSAYSCATMPWDFEHPELPYDEEEQARFYESAITVMEKKPWFMGFFWWDWSLRLYSKERGKSDTGFAIYGKRAEEVLRTYYQTDI